MQLVLGRAVAVVGAGLLLGAACAIVVGLTFRAIVPVDVPRPVHILTLITSVAVVALIAAVRPAWQALRVNPVDTLRAE